VQLPFRTQAGGYDTVVLKLDNFINPRSVLLHNITPYDTQEAKLHYKVYQQEPHRKEYNPRAIRSFAALFHRRHE
jgi:hypothetical protein